MLKVWGMWISAAVNLSEIWAQVRKVRRQGNRRQVLATLTHQHKAFQVGMAHVEPEVIDWKAVGHNEFMFIMKRGYDLHWYMWPVTHQLLSIIGIASLVVWKKKKNKSNKVHKQQIQVINIFCFPWTLCLIYHYVPLVPANTLYLISIQWLTRWKIRELVWEAVIALLALKIEPLLSW